MVLFSGSGGSGAQRVGRYAITLQWSSHYTSNFNCIKICGARRCLIINTPSGAVILTRPFLTFKIKVIVLEHGDGAYIMKLVLHWRHRLHFISRYYPYNFLLALLSPASDSLSSLDSKLRHSAYAHLRVARAQCVYGFYFLAQVAQVLNRLVVMLSPSSDHHITPQISIASKFVGP